MQPRHDPDGRGERGDLVVAGVEHGEFDQCREDGREEAQAVCLPRSGVDGMRYSCFIGEVHLSGVTETQKRDEINTIVFRVNNEWWVRMVTTLVHFANTCSLLVKTLGHFSAKKSGRVFLPCVREWLQG